MTKLAMAALGANLLPTILPQQLSLPDGKKIPAGPDTRFRGNVVAIESANHKNGLNITPKTSIPEWYGDSMDPEMAVDMLLVCE